MNLRSHFTCPSCQQPLQKQLAPPIDHGYIILWCGNRGRCPSIEAANNGGSGPTEEAAYRALLLSVKHEEDRETEAEPLSPEDLKDRNAWAKAEHANDMEKAGGV